MQGPGGDLGKAVEEIMSNFSKFNKDAVVVMDTPEYNRTYSRVLSTLRKYIKEDK